MANGVQTHNQSQQFLCETGPRCSFESKKGTITTHSFSAENNSSAPTSPRVNRRHRRRLPSVPDTPAVLPPKFPVTDGGYTAVPFYGTAVGALLAELVPSAPVP